MGKRQQGQGLVEYALILLLVAIIVVIAVSLFGETTGMKIGEVSLLPWVEMLLMEDPTAIQI